jgi:hypothetical protein
MCPCRCLAGAAHHFLALSRPSRRVLGVEFVVVARHRDIVGLGCRSPAISQWCAADMKPSPSRVRVTYLDAYATIALSCSAHTRSCSTLLRAVKHVQCHVLKTRTPHVMDGRVVSRGLCFTHGNPKLQPSYLAIVTTRPGKYRTIT